MQTQSQRQREERNVEIPLNDMRQGQQLNAHWRNVFNKYDTDGTGMISINELKMMIVSRDYKKDIPEYVTERIMLLSDRDNSGHLDFEEFIDMVNHPDLKHIFGQFMQRYIQTIIPPPRRPVDVIDNRNFTQRQHKERGVEIPLNDMRRGQHSDTYWRQVFNKYDTDGTGTISIHELKRMINCRECRDIPEYVTDRIMLMADRDNSGHLDFEEFLDMVNHPDLKHIFGRYMQRYIHTIMPVPRRRVLITDAQYEEQYAWCPPPVCMVLISVVEVILWFMDAVIQHPEATGPAATALIYNPYKRHEAWRFLSYMFVHVGWNHLIVNLLVQIMLGLPLEMVHRWWRVLVIYGAGVVAGSLGTSISDPNIFLAGASGGVYALLTAHISTIVLNWGEMEKLYAIVQLLFIFLLTGFDVGTAIYNRYVLDIEGNIGYVAHLAGAFAGLLVGIGILRNLEVKSWENKLWWVAVVVFVALMVIAIFMNIFWTSHFPATRYHYK